MANANEKMWDNGAHVDKVGEIVHGWIKLRVSGNYNTPDGNVVPPITRRHVNTQSGSKEVVDVKGYGTYAYDSATSLKRLLGDHVLDENGRASIRVAVFSYEDRDHVMHNRVTAMKLQPGADIIVTGRFTANEYNGRHYINIVATDMKYERKADNQERESNNNASTSPAMGAQNTSVPAAHDCKQQKPDSQPAPDARTSNPAGSSTFDDPFMEFMSDMDNELPFN